MLADTKNGQFVFKNSSKFEKLIKIDINQPTFNQKRTYDQANNDDFRDICEPQFAKNKVPDLQPDVLTLLGFQHWNIDSDYVIDEAAYCISLQKK